MEREAAGVRPVWIEDARELLVAPATGKGASSAVIAGAGAINRAGAASSSVNVGAETRAGSAAEILGSSGARSTGAGAISRVGAKLDSSFDRPRADRFASDRDERSRIRSHREPDFVRFGSESSSGSAEAGLASRFATGSVARSRADSAGAWAMNRGGGAESDAGSRSRMLEDRLAAGRESGSRSTGRSGTGGAADRAGSGLVVSAARP